MNKEQIQQRISELKLAVEQSAANHNALVGRLHEAEHVLIMMDECDLKDVEIQDQEQEAPIIS